ARPGSASPPSSRAWNCVRAERSQVLVASRRRAKARRRCVWRDAAAPARVIHLRRPENSAMPTDRAKLDYLNEIVRTRGYAHGSHRLLANHDLDVLKAVNDITLANYIPRRSLSEADKELVLVGAFTALRSQPAIIRAHIQKAA